MQLLLGHLFLKAVHAAQNLAEFNKISFVSLLI